MALRRTPAPAPHRASRLPGERVASVCAVACLLLGAVVLVGWHARVPRLVQVAPTLVAMAHNTALCLVLGGAALLALSWGRRGVAAACAVPIAGLAGLNLAQYATGADLGVDRWFADPFVQVKTSHPGRMAIDTAACFLGVAVGLAAASRRPFARRPALEGLLAVAVIAIAAVALLGYAFDLDRTTGWGRYTRMAPHTAAGIAALGVGLWGGVVAVPRSGERRLVLRALALPVGVVVLTLVLWQALREAEYDVVQGRVRDAATRTRHELDDRMRFRSLALVRAGVRLAHEGEAVEEAWRREARLLLADWAGLRSIAWLEPDGGVRWAEPREAPGARDRAWRDQAAEALAAAAVPGIGAALRLASTDDGRDVLHVVAAVRATPEEPPAGLLAAEFDVDPLFDVLLANVAVDYPLAVRRDGRVVYARGADDPGGRGARWALDEALGIPNASLHIAPGRSVLARTLTLLPEAILAAGFATAVLLALVLHLVGRTREANERLSARTREVEAFYHTLSHELKTPLASARELVSIVRDGIAGPLTADQAEYLSLARESVDQMKHLVDDLTDVARVETGKLVLDLRPGAVGPLVARVVDATRPVALARGIELVSEVGDLPRDVLLDAKRVSQVLGNLLSNALKFTPEGGRVTVAVARDVAEPDRVRVSVRDTGRGIPPEALPRLFERLYQVPDAEGATAPTRGMGLGLHLCRELVRLHGGRIDVESRLGVGSTFAFTLVEAPAPASPPRRAPAPVGAPRAQEDPDRRG